MLELAIKYEQQLQEKYLNVAMDEDYMFAFGCSYRDKLEIDTSTWNKHQFVSVNGNGEVVGYLKYNIGRDAMVCCGLQAINFKKNSLCTTFANDLKQLINDIFMKYNFRKLTFTVHIGNPAEKFYDKYIDKIGGRIVGIYKQEDKMIDGNYYDTKMYEVMKEDFVLSQYGNKLS